MATRTLLNPSVQIASSTAYTTTINPGVALQTGSLTIESDLNALRSQVQLLLDATGGTPWYSDVYTSATGQKRSVKQLNTGLSTIESKSVLVSAPLFNKVSVPAGQNYVILSVANTQAPTQPAAIQATTLGAVVAQSTLSGTAFGANELSVVTGANVEGPKNKAVIIDAATGNVVETADRDIFGLVQVESTAADGAAFNDTVSGTRVKLSFAYFDQDTNAIKACPAADIGGKTIKFTYNFRTTFAALTEDAFLNPQFIDGLAALDITASRAFTNQGGNPIAIAMDANFRVANGVNFRVQNSTGSKDLFAVTPGATSNAAAISTDTFAFNTTSPITSIKGATLATGGQAINLGVATGQIDSTGPLTVRAYGSNPLALNSGGTLTLTDGFEAASTWTSPAIALSSSSGDWSAYKAAYGEVSLLAGVLKAGQMGNHALYTATVTAPTIAANATATGSGANANLSASFPLAVASTVNPNTNILVTLNGALMDGAGNDYVIVSGANSTDLQFSFPLRGGSQPDKIKVQVFGNPALQTV